jgi:hypothetical protein
VYICGLGMGCAVYRESWRVEMFQNIYVTNGEPPKAFANAQLDSAFIGWARLFERFHLFL